MTDWFRVGRSNPRNLYLSSGSADYKADTPVGSMYEPDIGQLAVRALNYYLDAHPTEAPRPRSSSMDTARHTAVEGCKHPIEYRRVGGHPDVAARLEAQDIAIDKLYCLRCERPIEDTR
jgi:hypothetical protein